MPLHLLNEHRLLVTEDLQESQQFLSPIWERHQSVPRGSRFAIRWHQANLHRTTLAYVDHPCGVHATCDGPLGDYFRVLLPFSGRMENRINGKRAVLTPSSIVLHAPGQDLKLQIDEFRLLLLSFDGGFVRRAMERRFRKVPPLETWAAEFSQKSQPRPRSIRSANGRRPSSTGPAACFGRSREPQPAWSARCFPCLSSCSPASTRRTGAGAGIWPTASSP